jgi:hypothetical protein
MAVLALLGTLFALAMTAVAVLPRTRACLLA